MKKFYAYLIPDKNFKGIVENWPDCERMVKGVNGARHKVFFSEADASQWLEHGAPYEAHKRREQSAKKPHGRGLYFDAGTGRGLGLVEVSVTNEQGESQLVRILSPNKISKFGTYVIMMRRATNNYGELLASKYAFQIALKDNIKKIFGDSKLIIDYWSRGYVKSGVFRRSTYKLVTEVKNLREQFEKEGGEILRISGEENPADLGFHK